MILNKFRALFSSGYISALSPKLFAFSLIFVFSCNKSSDINGNKAFVSFTHVAYNVGPLTLQINNNDTAVFSAIPFDSATGFPYATVTSQISNTSIFENNDSFLSGFSSFRQGIHYSIYIYDTLDAHSKSMIILQDNPPLNSDTTVSIRYMNFAPSSYIGLLLINTRKGAPYTGDTTVIPREYFVGYDINPASYTFSPILAGNYNVIAYKDSARPAPDGSNFRSLGNFTTVITSNYNFNLTGFGNLDSTSPYKLQLKVVPLN